VQPETNDIIPSPEVQAQAADLIETTEAELEYQPVIGDSGGRKPDYYRTLPDGTIVAISRAEYKRGMHDQFTVKHRQLPCGHKLVADHNGPRHTNCDQCWLSYFQVFGEVTKAVEEAYQSKGTEVGAELIKQLRGVKFLKYFLRFMSTVALYKEQMEAPIGRQT